MEACRAGLPVPFDTYHRNDRPDEVRRACDGAPVVLAQTDAGFVLLLGPAQLAECDGAVDRLVTEIERAVVRAALRWPD